MSTISPVFQHASPNVEFNNKKKRSNASYFDHINHSIAHREPKYNLTFEVYLINSWYLVLETTR